MSAPLPQLTPVRDAFRSVSGSVQFLGSLVAIVVGFGLVTAAQGDAITGLLGLVPGAISAVHDVIKAFQVQTAVATAEAAVTPVENPQVEVDGQLVPLVPADTYGQHAA